MFAAGRLRSHPFGPSTVVTLVGACLLAVVLSACGGSDTTAPTEADRAIRSSTTADTATSTSTAPTTSTTISPPATTPIKGEEDEVRAAYLKGLRLYYELAAKPDPADDRLEKFYSGAALDKVRTNLSNLKNAGSVVPKAPSMPAELSDVQVSGDTAKVKVCIVDDALQVRAADATVVDDSVSSQLNSATLTKSDGYWRLSEQAGLQTWPDTKGCSR